MRGQHTEAFWSLDPLPFPRQLESPRVGMPAGVPGAGTLAREAFPEGLRAGRGPGLLRPLPSPPCLSVLWPGKCASTWVA